MKKFFLNCKSFIEKQMMKLAFEFGVSVEIAFYIFLSFVFILTYLTVLFIKVFTS